jgi:hypothetical protein
MKISLMLTLFMFLIVFNSILLCQDKSSNSNSHLPSGFYLEIKPSERYERYHAALLESSDDEIIQITLDRISYVNGSIFLFPTFYNKSDSTIYILKQSECIRPFRFIIENSNGEKIKPFPGGFLCDVNPRYTPNDFDLIAIPPSGVYHYPKVKAYSYSFSRLPKDEFKVKLKYYYQKPDSILIIGRQKENNATFYSSYIHTAQITLRGKYLSKNVLRFKN